MRLGCVMYVALGIKTVSALFACECIIAASISLIV